MKYVHADEEPSLGIAFVLQHKLFFLPHGHNIVVQVLGCIHHVCNNSAGSRKLSSMLY